MKNVDGTIGSESATNLFTVINITYIGYFII